jgi:hypothetical protein
MKTNSKIIVFSLAALTGMIIITGVSGSRPVQEKQLYKYVGLEKCASVCHNNNELGYQYVIVKNSGHAKAYKALESKKALEYAKKANVTGNPQESSVCLKCHTTGGGYGPDSFTATYKKEDGITCEACHKSRFISETVLPKETDCRKCHDNPIHKVGEFNFRERFARIAHPRLKFQNTTDKDPVDPDLSLELISGDGKPHDVGEQYGGGIVFYTYSNGQHGLIASATDQGKIRWNNGINRFTGSSGDGVGAGEKNTEDIIAALGNDDKTGSFAAKICKDYSVTVNGITFDDWYLPSKHELNLLYHQKAIAGDFDRAYWSSTEVDSSRAWNQYFNDGFQFSYNGKSYEGFVRAIRRF